MSRVHVDTARLYALFSAHVDDQLTPAQRDELEALLLESTAAQELYVDLVAQHSELTRIHRGLGPWGDLDIPGIDVNALPVSLANRIWGAATSWTRHPGFALVTLAATVLFCGLSVWLARESSVPDRSNIAATNGSVARLAWSDGVVWEGDAPSGAGISAGQQLVLRSGLAELHYKTGAVVILEGPAEFTVGDKDEGGTKQDDRSDIHPSSISRPSNSGYLALGKLLAWVEGPQAKGFTIELPSATVEDLGTEFAVQVQDDGASEVVVLTGSVDVSCEPDRDRPRQRMRMTTGQAAFFEADGETFTRRSVVDYRFISAMRSRLEVSRYDPAKERDEASIIAHWKLDGDAKDSVASHHGTLGGDAGFASGRMGQAVKLDGDGDFISTGTDPWPRANFTVSAWLFPDSVTQRMYVAGTQQSGNKGAFLMVGYDGVLSAVFPGTDLNKEVRSVSKTVPLQQWTHVAMTVSRSGGLRLYANGNLVAVDATMTSQHSMRNFTIGRRPDEPPKKDKYHYWRGLIDDVAVWKGVLTTKQLENVMDLGAENFDSGIVSVEPERLMHVREHE